MPTDEELTAMAEWPISRDVPALVAEVRRLLDLLTQYGRHQEGCSGAQGPQYRCRCGWRDEAAALGLGELDGPKGDAP